MYRGVPFDVSVTFMHEMDGEDFPTPDPEEMYTDAMVGFNLTERYRGAILDAEYTNGGRPEPFMFDPAELVVILDQVRLWWPEAQVAIWTLHY